MSTPLKPTENKTDKNVTFLFGRQNYILMLAGLAVIILGFVCMSGTTDIMSNTKIVVAPILVLAGFVIEFFAIFKKPAE
ncbi:DUF3098 domain-containing protein [Solitalea canadensis]|uniref:DUF3098 domain-containing protein n=1 Tax=Solitalea canadensis (strain ATCC 29591 / DSM 3403 / JCM 21819 / LMG 8368 / NBRC 15130 / NCIMB 12057 / USAM 9D) TaxID=929556 RepID=H8KNH4_SOLCM|nr:DUF3098 domain-containing protein [Solitalea canadensis]AFD07972.1 Protein of unknown function (DUF3098) [Solitalea canadensis DSM 3403]